VKQYAVDNGIPVIQPERISREAELLQPFNADVFITCAFGQMLRQNILDMPRHGVLNVHFSLLPKYRGSSPVQWAILEGQTTSGITIMQTDIGMDTGNILHQLELSIHPDETAGEVLDRYAKLAAVPLLTVLDALQQGTVQRTPQNHAEASHHPMLRKEDGIINWNRPALEIYNQIRALNPWPIAYFHHNGEVIRVHKTARRGDVASVTHERSEYCQSPASTNFANPGTILRADKNGLTVQCGNGTALELLTLQAPGGKILSARDFLNGRKLTVGEVLS